MAVLRLARCGVVVARFEDLVDRGLRALVEEDDAPRAASPPASRTSELDGGDRRASPAASRSSTTARCARPLEVRELRRDASRHAPDRARRPAVARRSATRCWRSARPPACRRRRRGRDVLSAIHLASRGLQVLPTAGRGCSPAPPQSGPELLTPRAVAVLELLQGGRSNGEIAAPAPHRRRDCPHPRAQHLPQAWRPLAT